jgi:DNA-binding IclR family transcriptional regulator
VKAEDDGAVRSVLRAFDLLALFTERRRAWAVQDLTAASGLAKTTVLRLVATCEQRGLLWTRRRWPGSPRG